MRIAVTASSGQLGSEIVRASIQLEGKENVIGLARTPSKATELGVEVRKGDYNSRNDLETSLKGVDSLLLVSGMDDPARRIQGRAASRGNRFGARAARRRPDLLDVGLLRARDRSLDAQIGHIDQDETKL